MGPDHFTEVEDCYCKAIQIAKDQEARSWELRAATSLARLWREQDKHGEAYELSAPIHDWFSESFDTADLKVAELLFDALA